MRKPVKLVRELSMIFVLGLESATSTIHAQTIEHRQKINIIQTIEQIKREKNYSRRTDLAQQLAFMTKEANPTDISDREIGALTSMMEDRDDSVRDWVAVALGFVGPRAISAAPALERALLKVRCSRLEKTSEFSIRLTLTKIGATPPPPDCHP